MNLPINFKWIETIGVLPKMVQQGINLLGVTEIPGAPSNPIILQIAKEIDCAGIYNQDDVPWCSVAHCGVAIRAGKIVPFVKYDRLRAKSWATWEQAVPKGQEMFGDTLVFVRPLGFHVGLYIGESPTHFLVLGGNQNNSYSFTRVAKTRLYACRRPKYNNMPPSVKKYSLTDGGTPITNNEQ